MQTLLVVHTSHTVVHNPVTVPCSGVWSSPLLKGEIPPPCSYFSFTKVNQDRVVLFGGYQRGRGEVNDLYLFNLRNMVSWCGVVLCNRDLLVCVHNSNSNNKAITSTFHSVCRHTRRWPPSGLELMLTIQC